MRTTSFLGMDLRLLQLCSPVPFAQHSILCGPACDLLGTFPCLTFTKKRGISPLLLSQPSNTESNCIHVRRREPYCLSVYTHFRWINTIFFCFRLFLLCIKCGRIKTRFSFLPSILFFFFFIVISILVAV